MSESTGHTYGSGEGAELASVLESSQDAIIGLTLDGIITSWNPAAARLYGYSAQEIVGCHASVLLAPQWLVEESDALERVTAGEYVEKHHSDRLCRDGTEVTVSLTMSPIIDATGAIVGAAAVSHRIGEPGDVSAFAREVDQLSAEAQADKERLDAHLQQGQRLENLQQLAGGVAHDFNNLLAVVLNYACFVAEELDALAESDRSEPFAAIRRDVGQIQRAAERATTLTHQLLAFARREVIEPQVLDLNDAVTAVEQMLRRTIGEDVELVTSLSDHLRPVRADPGQIELVLVNLAVNARDAMPGGGVLSIDTANITVDAGSAAVGSPVPEGRYVRLRVSDTGRGMSDEAVRQAFEPFFTTKGEGGAGLGLTTVHSVLTQANGHIQINSELGFGTTFTILLPVTDQVAVPIDEAAPAERTPTGETILVVEDDEALREVTERIFARNGYRVITAGSGAEAVELAASYEDEIHLLVTDVVMPHMLGKEVAEEIREIKPGIEVLFMSGYVQPGLGIEDRLDPGAVLVAKPFSEAALLDKAAQVLYRPR